MGKSTEPASTDLDGWVRAAFERFEGPLTRYACRLLRDVEEARDVVQETFLKLCGQERAKVAPHLAEWLFTVCRNRALDLRRKEGRVRRIADQESVLGLVPGPDADPAADAQRRDDVEAVLRMLGALTAPQQEVLRLRFQEGFSYKEISRITGYSVSNVGYLLHMGLNDLRERLQSPTAGNVRVHHA